MSKQLWQMGAAQVVSLLREGEVSATQLIDVAQQRIEQTNPAVNSIVTTCFDQAREQAARMERGETPCGLLCGLPIVIKDLDEVAGVRTTYGSPIYTDHVPAYSSAAVAALQTQGALVIGKSNTPEFGAGANTFNEVFGTTVSPFDTRKTCGGSSGGSAVALATGQAWLATGSDLGGSLRIPAAFCSVVGMRPTPGRVPRWPTAAPFDALNVVGPMARSVADLGLMLDAMSLFDRRDPMSFISAAGVFEACASEPVPPRRIAWTPDLGGCAPVDAEVRAICEAAIGQLEKSGTAVTTESPDFSAASDTFQTLRAAAMALWHDEHYNAHRDQLKQDLAWNIEKGLQLTAAELVRAETARARLYAETATFFESHDLLVTPTVMVPPFDATERYVTEVDGVAFDNYIDWVFHTFAITLTACPALSLPCGFTASGLPVGLQLVGPPRGEGELLSFAAHLEQMLGLSGSVPVDPATGGGS